MSKRTITTITTIATIVLALAAGGTALAGKPTSSLSLVMVGSDGARVAATAEPTWGSRITFDVSTTQTDRPFVNVRCYQAGQFVYDGWHGFFASYRLDPTFTLASTYWTSGPADCTARLIDFGQNGRERELAAMGFHVAG
jgi:hypothetical protein